jgi:protein-tyrosine phosphatase
MREADFEQFDWLLAMDRVNLRAARRFAAPGSDAKLELFLPRAGIVAATEVPDPYYGGHADFARVIELAEAGADGLIALLGKAHN